MIARLFVGGALIVLAAGFLWFTGNVIYLGIREFFKPKKAKSSALVATPVPAAPTSIAP